MTTNARNLRDELSDDEQYSDLPNPRDLEIGNEAQSGRTQRQAQRQKQAQDIHDTDDSKLPKEFQGKSVSELVAILQSKDQMIGRQANEIGHLRDLSDQLLKSQGSVSHDTAHSQSQDDDVQVSSDDILEDPRGAIQRVVEPLLSSAVNEIKQTVGGMQTSSRAEKFAKAHPTYEQDMADPAFQEFVRGSAYRQRLAAQAQQNTDFDAADELWTAWEEYQASHSDDDDSDDEGEEHEEHNQRNDQRQQQLRDASTVRSGNGERGGGSGNKPIYSARKLQDMRNNDPDGYYSPNFQKMIMEAYREGRVR